MFISKLIGEKRRWWQYKARVKRLPANYRMAVEALERYLIYFGRGDGAGWGAMYEDLIDLFERSAADQIPIREIVGQDPVEFIDAFIQNYPEGQWRIRIRDRLISEVQIAAGEVPESDIAKKG